MEAATVQTLAPGAYTVVSTGKDSDSGIALFEAYDLAAEADSKLANISTRGAIGTGDDVLISGFIVGDVNNATIVVRAIGPSLAAFGVSDPLADPMFTVYDANGAAIAVKQRLAGRRPMHPTSAAMDLHRPIRSKPPSFSICPQVFTRRL